MPFSSVSATNANKYRFSFTPLRSDHIGSYEPNFKTCEQVPKDICAQLPYSDYSLPNIFNHKTAEDVLKFASNYKNLTEKCGSKFALYLCTFLFPSCSSVPKLCRSLCLASSHCKPFAISLGFHWPKGLDDCESYPNDSDRSTTCWNNVDHKLTENKMEIFTMPLPFAYSRNEIGLSIELSYGTSKNITLFDCTNAYATTALEMLQNFEMLVSNISQCSIGADVHFVDNSTSVALITPTTMQISSDFAITGLNSRHLLDCYSIILKVMNLSNGFSHFDSVPPSSEISTEKCPELSLIDIPIILLRTEEDPARSKRSIVFESCLEPKIKFITTDTYVTVGESVSLTCSVNTECDEFQVSFRTNRYSFIKLS